MTVVLPNEFYLIASNPSWASAFFNEQEPLLTKDAVNRAIEEYGDEEISVLYFVKDEGSFRDVTDQFIPEELECDPSPFISEENGTYSVSYGRAL